MNNDLKVKIIGDDTSNLLLAFLLLKKGYKVQILKKLNISNKTRNEKLFFISHSTKLFLDDFNLWSQLQDKAYSLESLSISEMSILKKIDIFFRDFNFNKSNLNNIGWILRNSDFDALLLQELSKFNNVFSALNININSEIKDTFNNLILTIKDNYITRSITSFLSKNNLSSIEFTASLRGYIDQRFYTIINDYGLIFLCPRMDNLFSIRWITKKSFSERVQSIRNGFLLDNLSTILPKEINIDEIFGDLNITAIYPNISKEFSKIDNYLMIKDGPLKLLDFKLEGLNLSFKEVIFIYNQINKVNLNKKQSYLLLKLKFLVLRYFKFIISTTFYKCLMSNNYFLKNIIFYLFKKVSILKKFLLKFIFLNF